MKQYRYKFIGDYACSTLTPPVDWEVGDEKTVDTQINHPWFVEVPLTVESSPVEDSGDGVIEDA